MSDELDHDVVVDAPTVRGVIFDLDGTLYTISWLKLAITMGMPLDSKKLRTLFKARDAIRHRSFGSRDALMMAFTAELSSKTGDTPGDVHDWYEKRFMPRFVRVLGRRGTPRAGLLELLGRLREKGTRLAVVSDFGLVKERLEALKIPEDLFDTVKSAEDFGVMKPSEVPYKFLMNEWGFEPDEVLLVGDRQDQDQKSAQLCGAQFIGISGDEPPSGAFKPWPEVIRIIDEETEER